MKARVVFATDVVESDAFLCLSEHAQLAYYHLCASAKPSGKVVGVRRVLKSYGFGDAELAELMEGGYLIDCDGTVFVTHTWAHNKFEKRLYDIAMGACDEYKSGRLVFAGEAGKSAYRLANISQTVGKDLAMKCCDVTCGESEVSCNDSGKEVLECGGNAGGETDAHPCICQRCGATNAKYSRKPSGETIIECPSCGEMYPYER